MGLFSAFKRDMDTVFDLPKKRRRKALEGATVVAFDCRGCMAENHQFDYLGIVEGFEPTRYAGDAARIRVLKRDNQDYRDVDLGTTLEIVSNGSLQQLGPKLFVMFR
jgi:hypothetical protein